VPAYIADSSGKIVAQAVKAGTTQTVASNN